MVITVISYHGERLGGTGQAFVMDRIGMHTRRLSLRSEYKHVRQRHTLKSRLPLFPFNLMAENCAVAHTLFHRGCCHLRPVLIALLLRCSKSHTQTHTCRHTVYDANGKVGWCILHTFPADCPCASDACEWDLQSQTNQTPHTPTLWVPLDYMRW